MADPESTEPQRDPDPPAGPYIVEPIRVGCAHCGVGASWMVRGPALPEWELDNVHFTEQDAIDTARDYNAIWAAAIASVHRD